MVYIFLIFSENNYFLFIVIFINNFCSFKKKRIVNLFLYYIQGNNVNFFSYF